MSFHSCRTLHAAGANLAEDGKTREALAVVFIGSGTLTLCISSLVSIVKGCPFAGMPSSVPKDEYGRKDINYSPAMLPKDEVSIRDTPWCCITFLIVCLNCISFDVLVVKMPDPSCYRQTKCRGFKVRGFMHHFANRKTGNNHLSCILAKDWHPVRQLPRDTQSSGCNRFQSDKFLRTGA